jgi:hypothetical protein
MASSQKANANKVVSIAGSSSPPVFTYERLNEIDSIRLCSLEPGEMDVCNLPVLCAL